MKKLVQPLFFFTLTACGLLTDYKEGPFKSPDATLEISAFVNRTDNTKPNYAKVVLTVFDKTNNQTSILETGIGDAMKWAVDWYNENTIVAQSSDIGTRSWRFEKGRFEELSVTPEMQIFAEQLRIKKYKLNE